MDINDLRGISTAFLLVTFIALIFWAYSGKRKKTFDDAANLPFADEDPPANSTRPAVKEESNA